MAGDLMARVAAPQDAPAIARIYNQGIADRLATFETRLRSAEDVAGWLTGSYPVVVVEREGAVVAFAAASAYRPRECYAGIAEVSVYVAREARRLGAGRLALQGLIDAAAAHAFWKLLSRIFPENTASRALVKKLGFREVGVYQKHGQLDGVWRDVIIVERLISANQPDQPLNQTHDRPPGLPKPEPRL